MNINNMTANEILEYLKNKIDDVKWVPDPDNPNLLWEAKPTKREMSWEEARVYAESIGGRLPTVNELINIYDYTEGKPKIDGFSSRLFWSSTTYTGNTSDAWNVFFNYGSVNIYKKTNAYRVRCVKELSSVTHD